jgi:hypothetical protein
MLIEETAMKTLLNDITGDDSVAACPISKLVYYLSCVARLLVLDDDAIPAKFKTGFCDELVFNAREREELLIVARRWHPDVITGAAGVSRAKLWMRVHFHEPLGTLERELVAEKVRALTPLVSRQDDFLATALRAISERPPARPAAHPRRATAGVFSRPPYQERGVL